MSLQFQNSINKNIVCESQLLFSGWHDSQALEESKLNSKQESHVVCLNMERTVLLLEDQVYRVLQNSINNKVYTEKLKNKML